jgi:hypothetical protein
MADKNMTLQIRKLANYAEMQARQGKKNFLHVDILLKS